MGGAAFQSHPEGFLISTSTPTPTPTPTPIPTLTPSWLQDGSRSLYVGSSWSPEAQHGPQRLPKYPKMSPRWPSRCLPHRYVLASWSFFRDLLPDLRFPMKFCFSGVWNASIFINFWNKFRRILDHFWYVGSCMPLEVLRYSHDCCRIAYFSLSGSYMDLSWLQVGSS